MKPSVVRKTCIANGFAALMYVALRTYKPHAGAAVLFTKVLLLLVAAIGIITTVAFVANAVKRKNDLSLCPEASPFTFTGPASALRYFLMIIAEGLYLVGRHVLILVVVTRFDSGFLILYREYGRAFRILHRILVTLSLTEWIALAVSRFLPKYLTAEDRIFLKEGQPFFRLMFYLSFAYLLCNRLLYTTMFTWMSRNDDLCSKLLRLSCNILLLLAVFAASSEKNHFLWGLMTAILVVGFLHYRDGGTRQTIWFMCVLIVAAAGKEKKKILWIFVLETAVVIAVSYICMQRGILLNLISFRSLDVESNIPRYALGFRSQTDIAAHLLYLTLAWCMIRPNKSRWWSYLDYLLLFLFYFVTARINHATANAILILIVIAVTFTHQLYKVSGHSISERSVKRLRFLTIPAAFSYLIFFAVSCLLGYFYRPSSEQPYEKLISLLPNKSSYMARIYFAHDAFVNYKINLLGNDISEVGNGGKLTKPSTYTFLDISYVRILLVGGILFTLIILGILTWMQLQNARTGALYVLFLLFIVSANCLVEHHIFEFYYNIFPVLVFAAPPVRSSSLKP